MATYDPKRTRPVSEPEPLTEPAPIDALLESTSGGIEGGADVVDLRAPGGPAVPSAPASGPATSAPKGPPPVMSAPPPDRRVSRIAAVAGVAAATTALIMLWRRSRRR